MVPQGSVTYALLMVYFLVLFCPEVSDIFLGDLVVGAIEALTNVVHSRVIRYQKHLMRANLPPLEFSFFSKSCAVSVAFLMSLHIALLIYLKSCG